MTEYAGNRWYKCDLHLHTMSSECYLDKENTPAQWVDRALEQGLQVCAVTDHNDYRGISAIMQEGQSRGLAVFPGVEITCDSSKIHMLILFNVNKTAETVRDFLNRCDIDSDLIGSSEGTSLSVFEVCQIAKKRGAMVIAAHIDEFNAISSMNPANLDKLLSSGLLDAVQVANAPVWEKYAKDKNSEEMIATIRNHYGADATPDVIETWRKCYNRAKEVHLPMLSFSDNPRSATESKHGLWGIGSMYTWVQMNKEVNLESLRQAMLTPDSRTRTCFESPLEPKTEPWFWLQSLEVRKTELNPYQPIHLDFNPQLNCIIGGRGSGKSAIVRLLSGVYQRLESGLLTESAAAEETFYKQKDGEGYGIFHDDSEIEICFRWYGIPYRLVISDIQSSRNQNMKFTWTDQTTGEEKPDAVTAEGFRGLMSAQVFTQREIAELACTPGALLEYVDASIADMYIYKNERDYTLNRRITISMEIQALQKLLNEETLVSLEKDWLFMPETKAFSRLPESMTNRMVELRSQTLARLNQAREELKNRQAELENCCRTYQESLAKIRQIRTAFVQEILKDDGNYRMELLPEASRESFYRMLCDTLKVNTALIREDAHTLENALFSKNGAEEYRKLLSAVRLQQDNDFSDYFRHQILSLGDVDFERLCLFCPEDELVISYHPNGVKKFFPMAHASAGEMAAAVLAFILANDNGPLIIDQPEDDLDNRMIYEELIGKLKRAKQQRQMILVTHDANITANADPEMIISMDQWSKFNRVRLSGSIDSPDIQKELCDVLEGSEQAFRQRARKYHLE